MHQPSAFQAETERVYKDLLYRLATAAFFSMNLMMYTLTLYIGFFQEMPANVNALFTWLACAMATPVIFYSGWPFIKGAWRSIRNLHPDMDALIATGGMVSYVYSVHEAITGGRVYFETASMIVTLALVGRLLEHSARRRACFAVERLAALSPKEARVLVDGEERLVPAELVRVGDVLRVRPGEKIPVDGIVLEGSSAVDESVISGEWVPRDKLPGQRVTAGTLNKDGLLTIQATGVGAQTVLAQIRHLVERALLNKALIQRVADKVAAVFVPAVLVLGAVTFVSWLLAGQPVGPSLMKAVAVVVIACPCAFGLATPAAITVATARASELGILFKGGEVVERASGVTTVIFDKTGTVTEARARVARCVPREGAGISERELLALAAAVEDASEHPLARAVVAHAVEQGLTWPRATAFKAHAGKGVEANVRGEAVLAGSLRFLKEHGVRKIEGVERIASALAEEGQTTVLIASKGAAVGVIGLADATRPSASTAIKELQALGMDVALVTGDSAASSASVARHLGITLVKSEMSPAQKAEFIQDLRAGGKVVAMVGDGVNDAPSLTASDVGIAVSDGSDIALASAQVTILGAQLTQVPLALRLARRCMRTILQNLFWAFFYNIAGIPLAALGLLNPIYAACAMAASSSIVLTNSLRLRRFGCRQL
jgi:heavy metal translocating P-type ATPase